MLRVIGEVPQRNLIAVALKVLTQQPRKDVPLLAKRLGSGYLLAATQLKADGTFFNCVYLGEGERRPPPPGVVVGPLRPQPGQRPGLPIGPSKAPPDVLAGAPIGLVVTVRGDDAAPPLAPGIAVGGRCAMVSRRQLLVDILRPWEVAGSP